jgi:kynurenine formamidase
MTRRSALLAAVAAAGTVGLCVVLGQGASAQPQGSSAPANQGSVTKEQFDQWMTKLSNWGRWGKEDERGALNLITADKARQAATLAKTGTTVSLARQIPRQAPKGTQPRPVDQGGAFTSHFLIQGDFLFERMEVEYHGLALSHFDALCHVSYNGRNYNGFVFKDIVTPDGGCARLSVNSAKDGIVTRGVLVDLPNTRVRPQEITAWEKKTGIRISAGDALLLRTSQPGTKPLPFGSAGYDPSLIPFLRERDVALIGADVPQEGGTVPGVAVPIHVFALVALGVNLLDNLALDELAATADKLKRWEFMLVVQPLRADRGAGSAVNPTAIF